MEKEKKKFNLSGLLRIYLRKKNKGLHCPSCRPPSAAGTSAEPAPPPRSHWTVKLSQMIEVALPAGASGAVFKNSICTSRGTAAD